MGIKIADHVVLEEHEIIEKTGRKIIVIAPKQYEENSYIDVREFYLRDSDDRFCPSKKGLTFTNVEQIDQAIKALEKFKKELKK